MRWQVFYDRSRDRWVAQPWGRDDRQHPFSTWTNAYKFAYLKSRLWY